MIDHLREHTGLYLLILFWVGVTVAPGPWIYAVLPLSVFLMRQKEAWPDMIMGFLIILILSDMNPGLVPMRKVKTAKYGYIVALSIVFLIDTARFYPISNIFKIFLPFFIYSFFPLLFSGSPVIGFEKTVSYALLYLIVPNYILMNYRQQGWAFFRNFLFFIIIVLWFSRIMTYFTPYWWTFIEGRFRGLFGNPNGLGIFSFLTFILAYTINYMNKQLFSQREKIIVFGSIFYFLIACGSRTSLVASLMFLGFARFFSLSPFFGFLAFLAFIALLEVAQNNIVFIVRSLGVEEYFRVETLADGSGRYFAWQFAWERITNDGFFLFGGGFGNDEYIMRQHYPYLRSMGHHGGVHNSYLTMWFNTGIIGILLFFRSFILMFIKANKQAPIAFALMFSVIFSVLYESWLTGSLNPFTIMLLIVMTMMSEEEIIGHQHASEEEEEEHEDQAGVHRLPPAMGVRT